MNRLTTLLVFDHAARTRATAVSIVLIAVCGIILETSKIPFSIAAGVSLAFTLVLQTIWFVGFYRPAGKQVLVRESPAPRRSVLRLAFSAPLAVLFFASKKIEAARLDRSLRLALDEPLPKTGAAKISAALNQATKAGVTLNTGLVRDVGQKLVLAGSAGEVLDALAALLTYRSNKDSTDWIAVYPSKKCAVSPDIAMLYNVPIVKGEFGEPADIREFEKPGELALNGYTNCNYIVDGRVERSNSGKPIYVSLSLVEYRGNHTSIANLEFGNCTFLLPEANGTEERERQVRFAATVLTNEFVTFITQ